MLRPAAGMLAISISLFRVRTHVRTSSKFMLRDESAANEAGADGMGGPPAGDDDDFMGADLDGAGDHDEPSVEEVD